MNTPDFAAVKLAHLPLHTLMWTAPLGVDCPQLRLARRWNVNPLLYVVGNKHGVTGWPGVEVFHMVINTVGIALT